MHNLAAHDQDEEDDHEELDDDNGVVDPGTLLDAADLRGVEAREGEGGKGLQAGFQASATVTARAVTLSQAYTPAGR